MLLEQEVVLTCRVQLSEEAVDIDERYRIVVCFIPAKQWQAAILQGPP